jgi:GTP pyrophosphokinase
MVSQVVPKIRDLYEKEVKKVQKDEEQILHKHNSNESEYSKKRQKNSPQGITVKGLDNILVRFAKCCNPLPGDDIIGYITKGRGVAVHRSDCPNAKLDSDFFQNRLIEVSWTDTARSKFEAEIQVKCIDRKGIINDITHIVAMDKVSLNGINARKSKESIVMVNLLIEVDDISELNTVMKKIRSIPGVEDVYRVLN